MSNVQDQVSCVYLENIFILAYLILHIAKENLKNKVESSTRKTQSLQKQRGRPPRVENEKKKDRKPLQSLKKSYKPPTYKWV